MIQLSGRMVIFFVSVGLGPATFLSCATEPAIPPAGQNGDGVGSVDLQLQLAPDIALNSAVYGISGPGSFTKIGTIKVSGGTVRSTTIRGVPAGDGYAIGIMATASDDTTTCAGSTMFNVSARSTAPAAVHLTCHQASTNGSVAINGTITPAW